LVILPFFTLPDEALSEIANRLAHVDYALVIVAEGYAKEARAKEQLAQSPLCASAYFKLQLERCGLVDGPKKRVIAEPFSRYIRGVRPAFLEVSAAYLKSSLLFDAFEQGRTEIMPYVLAANDVGVRSFDAVTREDRVERSFLPLLDRLDLPRFQTWIRDHYAAAETV
jgi:hypothetical protein